MTHHQHVHLRHTRQASHSHPYRRVQELLVIKINQVHLFGNTISISNQISLVNKNLGQIPTKRRISKKLLTCN